MCVRYARRGAIFAIAASASSTVKCVECFLSRRASMTSVSTPSTSGHDGVRNGAAVGQIRDAAETKAEDRHVAVQERHRQHSNAADLERAVDLMRLDQRNATSKSRNAIEYVMERPADVRPYISRWHSRGSRSAA